MYHHEFRYVMKAMKMQRTPPLGPVTPPSTPPRTLGPVTLSRCGGPVDIGTPRTDRKRGFPEWTETLHWGLTPFGFATYQDVTSSPAPLYPHWVPEWGTTGERVGVSPAGFGLAFPPRWLGTNELMPPARRQAMRILLDGE